MLFGKNSLSAVLLAVLGLKESDVPRFRDCVLDGERIVIYTRTGGGNREWYGSKNEDNPDGPWNSDLQGHPLYERDEDDDFDSTYASFYFKFPPELADDLKALSAKVETHTPSEKWQELFKSYEMSNALQDENIRLQKKTVRGAQVARFGQVTNL